MMTDIEELKKKKMQELMAQQASGAGMMQAGNQEAQMKEELKKIMLQILTPKARERLNNIRVAKPDIAQQVEIALVQIAQSGQVQIPINELQFRQIMEKLIPKKDFRIIRK